MLSRCRSSPAGPRLALVAALAAAWLVAGCEEPPGPAADGGETSLGPATVGASPEPGRGEPQAAPTLPTLRVAFGEAPAASVPPDAGRTVFSVSSVRELFVHAIWSALDGEHYEVRRFHAPSGDLYYQKLLPFSTEIAAPVPFTQRVDIPHASVIIPVQLDEQQRLMVSDYLALAGSWIGDHAITGTWTVQIHLDGAKEPSIVQPFELVP